MAPGDCLLQPVTLAQSTAGRGRDSRGAVHPSPPPPSHHGLPASPLAPRLASCSVAHVSVLKEILDGAHPTAWGQKSSPEMVTRGARTRPSRTPALMPCRPWPQGKPAHSLPGQPDAALPRAAGLRLLGHGLSQPRPDARLPGHSSELQQTRNPPRAPRTRPDPARLKSGLLEVQRRAL